MKLVAHRGGRGFGTDNTIEAMERAVDAGVAMIETDVRMTEDGRLIICHDSTIWGRLVGRTSYEELHHLAPERPLMSEMLERLSGKVALNIEVKEAPAELVAELLEEYDVGPETLVTSFHPSFVERFKSLMPYVATGYLFRTAYRLEKKVRRARSIEAEVLLPYFNSIDPALVDLAHSGGLEVWAWTVNDTDDFDRLRKWGADGVITDRYLALKQHMERGEG